MSVIQVDGQVDGRYQQYQLLRDFIDIDVPREYVDIPTPRQYDSVGKGLSPNVQHLSHEPNVVPIANGDSTVVQCLPTDNSSKSDGKSFRSAKKVASPAGCPSFQCRSCTRPFTTRRSLLRHSATVHGTKTIACAECERIFTRKDTRDRHMTEQHSDVKILVECMHCGRFVVKRAFSEHLESDVCEKARMSKAVEARDALMAAPVKYMGADDDPFLAALRMLRSFAKTPATPQHLRFPRGYHSLFSGYDYCRICNDRGRMQVRGIWLHPRSRYLEPSLLRYENIVVALLAQKIAESRVPLIGLSMTAWLLGCMASTVEPQSLKSSMHFVGAAKLFKMQHDNACGCGSHNRCPIRPPFYFSAERCVELALIRRLLVEHDILCGVIKVDAREEAFEHPDKLLREGTVEVHTRLSRPIRMRKRTRAREVAGMRTERLEIRGGQDAHSSGSMPIPSLFR